VKNLHFFVEILLHFWSSKFNWLIQCIRLTVFFQVSTWYQSHFYMLFHKQLHDLKQLLSRSSTHYYWLSNFYPCLANWFWLLKFITPLINCWKILSNCWITSNVCMLRPGLFCKIVSILFKRFFTAHFLLTENLVFMLAWNRFKNVAKTWTLDSFKGMQRGFWILVCCDIYC
jgi:hypothetical protein